jgi:hypothetical protein
VRLRRPVAAAKRPGLVPLVPDEATRRLERLVLVETVPVIMDNGLRFAVRLADSSEPHRSDIRQALRGAPVPEREGALAYVWDLDHWARGSPWWL